MALTVRNRINHVLQHVEDGFTTVFGGRNNPLHQLGALTIFFFWIVLVTGLYLFVFYETSLSGAYDSLERITYDQWWHAGVMRSLHRYASDAAVITMILHLSREFIRDRYRSFRWYSWFTGVPLLWMVYIFGITGYWMVWDELAQYIALSTAELLDVLPVFTDPMARNFLLQDLVSERFFTLMAFIHLVGLPIVLVLGLWFHLLRITQPKINPPRTLMVGTFSALLVLSLLRPAESQGRADLSVVPTELQIDWFYLPIYPIMDGIGPIALWFALIGLTLFMASLPWLPPRGREPVAEVFLENCTGCTFCADDCPYGAIDMVTRSDGRRFPKEAKVNPTLCASCGICTGSCPSSSPFRTVSPLVSGIEMPQGPMDGVKRQVDEAMRKVAEEETKVLVVGCEYSVDVEGLDRAGAAPVRLPCTGMLPPSALDYALRSCGADGVLLTGCDCADCHFRLGNRWTDERLQKKRPPYLGGRSDRTRIRTVWTKSVGRKKVLDELDALFADVQGRAAAGGAGKTNGVTGEGTTAREADDE